MRTLAFAVATLFVVSSAMAQTPRLDAGLDAQHGIRGRRWAHVHQSRERDRQGQKEPHHVAKMPLHSRNGKGRARGPARCASSWHVPFGELRTSLQSRAIFP